MKFCLLFFIPTSCSPVRPTHLTGLLLSCPGEDYHVPTGVASLKAFQAGSALPLTSYSPVCNQGTALKRSASLCYFFPMCQNYDTDPRLFISTRIPRSAPSP